MVGTLYENSPSEMFSCRNSLAQPFVKPLGVGDSDDDSDDEDDDVHTTDNESIQDEDDEVWDVNFNKWYLYKSKAHLKRECLSEREVNFFTTITPKKIEELERNREGTDDFVLNLVNNVQEFHNAFVCDMHKMVDLLIGKPWELCHSQQTVWRSKMESSPQILLKDHSRYCALYYPSEYERLHLQSSPKKNISLKKKSSPKKIDHPLEFTEEEEILFAKRFDEGYDFDTDARYNAWKSQKEVNDIVSNLMSIPDMNLSGLVNQMTEAPLDMPIVFDEEEIPELPPPVVPVKEVAPPPEEEVLVCPPTPGTSTPPTRRSQRRDAWKMKTL